jgi:Flp pilus assembly pilin Flp
MEILRDKGIVAKMMGYLTSILTELTAFLRGEEGHSLVEYTLILVVISLVPMVILTALGVSINDPCDKISDIFALWSLHTPSR